MLSEVARRLLGRRPGMQDIQQKPDITNTNLRMAWRGTADYLKARMQSSAAQKPGRSADMSPLAASAFLSVVEEVAGEAEVLPSSSAVWGQLENALANRFGSD